ncbi:hypothetical protein [Herbidospora sp. RD11066]
MSFEEPSLIRQLRETYPAWRFWRGQGESVDRPWNATRRSQMNWMSRPEGYAATLFGSPEQLRAQLIEQATISGGPSP